MMKKLWKGLRHNHKGLSLVELICTVAIFSIATTAIGGAMIVGSRNYQRGNTELELQQQAQIAANLLSNLIIDADEAEILDDGRLHVKKGSDEFYVFYDSGEIKYSDQADGAGAQVLAERVTDFTAQTDTNKNVNISLEFASQDGRTFANNFNITPRNASSMAGSDEETGNRVRLYVENEITLEPNQEYDLSVRIVGTNEGRYTVSPVSGSVSGSGTTVSNGTMNSTDEIHIKVGSNETNESFSFTVTSVENATVSQLVTVHVRRVNQLRLSGVLISGINGMSGAKYKVTSSLDGINLDKVLGAWYDVDYVDPYPVEWEKDSGEGSLYTAQLINDPLNPYMIITLNRDMITGDVINITATAMHPEGENSSGVKTNKRSVKDNSRVPYGDSVKDTWTLRAPGWGRMGQLNLGYSDLDDNYFQYNTKWVNYNPPHQDENGNWIWSEEVIDPDSKWFKGKIKVEVYAYRSESIADWRGNDFIADQRADVDYERNHTGTGAYCTYDSGDYDDPSSWMLTLCPYDTDHTTDKTQYFSYSSPYIHFIHELDGHWRDVVRYKIVEHLQDKNGNWTERTIELDVEDVKIQYKNTSDIGTAWNRDNHVFVTQMDSIVDYKVYFMFDGGWGGDAYFFQDISRYVGVIYDDPTHFHDVRYDINVSVPDSYAEGETSYMTFRLDEDAKRTCYNLTKDYGGILQEIYEYNPYLGKWKIGKETWDGEDVIFYPSAHKVDGSYLPLNDETLRKIDGCEGKVIFHFVDPNIYERDASGNPQIISGVNKPLVVYCPKRNEIDSNLYYIDDNTRYNIVSSDLAYYQVKTGDSWGTVLTLDWSEWNDGEEGLKQGWIVRH